MRNRQTGQSTSQPSDQDLPIQPSSSQSKKQQKPNKLIIYAIIAAQLLVLLFFYFEVQRSPNNEFYSGQEDFIPTQVRVTSEQLHTDEDLEQAQQKSERPLRKLSIVTYSHTEAHVNWLYNEYFGRVNQLRKDDLVVIIHSCSGLAKKWNAMLKRDEKDYEMVFKIHYSSSCQIPKLLSSGLKLAKEHAEFVMILEPGFSIYVNDNNEELVTSPDHKLGQPNEGELDVPMKKLRVDELLNAPYETSKLFQSGHSESGLLIVQVYDAPNDVTYSADPTTEGHLMDSTERAHLNHPKLFWQHRHSSLYSEYFTMSKNHMQKHWEGTKNSLFVPFSINSDSLNVLRTLPPVFWFIFATRGREFKNEEILDGLIVGLENLVDEKYYQNHFHFVETRKFICKHMIGALFEHIKKTEKRQVPPIYMLPPPYIIEWKQSHDTKRESSELLKDGFTYGTHCSLDRIPQLTNLIQNMNKLDNLVVVFHAKSVEECTSYQLQNFVRMEKKVSLTFKCLVNPHPRTAKDYEPNYGFDSENKLGTDYPVNILRNEVMLMTQTKWMFMIDADFIVSNNLRIDLMKTYIQNTASSPRDMLNPLDADEVTDYWKSVSPKLNRYATISQYLEHENVALVIPAFGSKLPNKKLPRDFNALLTATRKGKAFPILYNSVPEAHQNVDYQRYFQVSGSSGKAYQVKSYYPFEPYVIGHMARLPFYDEDFIYYGNDKVVYHIHMALRYFQYMVIPQHFIIHQRHKTGSWRKNKNEQYEAKKERKLKIAFKQFYKKMFYLYGNQRFQTFRQENNKLLYKSND